MNRILFVFAVAAILGLGFSARAQVPQPDPSSFQTVEEATAARDRAAAIRDNIGAHLDALRAAVNDPNVVVINDGGDYRVVTAQQMDEFVARVQLVYLIYPEHFKDIIPQLAAAAGMPEFVVTSALEGDANELAVSTLMAALRENMGVTPEQAQGVAMNFGGFLVYLDDYVKDAEARIAELQNPSAAPAATDTAPAESAPGIGAVGPDGMPIVREFQNPMEGGAPLDHCLIFPDCDSSAANRFCKNQGMLMAVYWEVANAPKTYVPGTGKFCEATIPGQCAAFTMIRCRY